MRLANLRALGGPCGCALLLLAVPASAAVQSDRAWEVVTVEGRLFPPQFRAPAQQLSLLRAAGGALEPIPFQIEERDHTGRLALPDGPAASRDESPGVFDDNDLLVFAVRDLGEHAAIEQAVEIRVTDPLTGQDGWAYLHARPGTPATTRDDVRYDPATDTVHARRYTLAFGPHTPSAFGFAGTDGAPGRNLLDHLKVRVTARILWGLIEFRRNEDDVLTTVLAWQDGPVRVIRRARLSVRLGYALPDPTFVAEDYFTADAFEGPVIVRLPFDLRYVFGDLVARIFLDFDGLDGYRLFTASRPPLPVGCGLPPTKLNDVEADWFGMTGPEGTFVHALRVSPTMQSVRRRLFVSVSATPDPPERTPGNCPGVGYTLTDWRGIGRGTHQIGMVIRAFEHYAAGDAQRFIATLDHPLVVVLSRAGEGVRTVDKGHPPE